MQADAPKPVALLPPANAASVLCSDLASARAALAADPGYKGALVVQQIRRELAIEVNKARATFRIVR
jgi:hypothetical protein